MTVAFRAVGTNATVTGATSGTIVIPAGTQAGDLLLAWVEVGSIVTGMSTPAGWTQFSWSPVVDGVNSNAFAFWKIAGASESNATITWTSSSKIVAVCLGYFSTDPASTLGANNVNIETVAQFTATTPSLTAVASQWAVTFHSSRTSTTGNKSPTWTAPGGLTLRQQIDNGAAASAPWNSVAAYDSAGDVATGAAAYTATSSFSEAHHKSALIYINEAPAGSATWLPSQQRRSRPVTPRQRLRLSPPAADQQQAPPPQPHRPRMVLARLRGRTVTPVPVQAAVAPPQYPPRSVRRQIRGLLARRGHAATPVPTQAAVVPPARVPAPVHRLRQAVGRIRGRQSAPPAAQPALIPASVAHPRRLLLVIRRRRSAPVPAQVVIVPPPRVAQPLHRRLLAFVTRRGRAGFPPPLATVEPVTCTTPRPDEGTTTRPQAGTTAYDTSMTARPTGGTTIRPNTGTTEPPC